MSFLTNIVTLPLRIVRGVLKVALGLLVVAAVAVGATNAFVIVTTSPSIVSSEQAKTANAEAIVVLGASVLPDGTPSAILKDRLDDAAALYSEGASQEILVSGASTEDGYCEAAYMKSYLVSAGIPEDSIVCDYAGYSTYETMYRAHYVFGYDSVIVATQEYHLARSLFNAQGLGMKAVGVAAGVGHSYDDQVFYNVREVFSRVKDAYQVAVKALPEDTSAAANLASYSK